MARDPAAAGELKQRWPSVAGSHFGTDARQLSQQDRGSATQRGQGTRYLRCATPKRTSTATARSIGATGGSLPCASPTD
jgi:hypothetical protein